MSVTVKGVSCFQEIVLIVPLLRHPHPAETAPQTNSLWLGQCVNFILGKREACLFAGATGKYPQFFESATVHSYSRIPRDPIMTCVAVVGIDIVGGIFKGYSRGFGQLY